MEHDPEDDEYAPSASEILQAMARDITKEPIFTSKQMKFLRLLNARRAEVSPTVTEDPATTKLRARLLGLSE